MSPTGSSPQSLESEVAEILESMYAAYLDGDQAGIDQYLATDITVFDSAEPDLAIGRHGLEALRSSRALPPDYNSGEGIVGKSVSDTANLLREVALTVSRLVVRTIGTHVIAAYWLKVDLVDADGRPLSPELSRNSIFFVRDSGNLLIAHIHEDIWHRTDKLVTWQT